MLVNEECRLPLERLTTLTEMRLGAITVFVFPVVCQARVGRQSSNR